MKKLIYYAENLQTKEKHLLNASEYYKARAILQLQNLFNNNFICRKEAIEIEEMKQEELFELLENVTNLQDLEKIENNLRIAPEASKLIETNIEALKGKLEPKEIAAIIILELTKKEEL